MAAAALCRIRSNRLDPPPLSQHPTQRPRRFLSKGRSGPHCATVSYSSFSISTDTCWRMVARAKLS